MEVRSKARVCVQTRHLKPQEDTKLCCDLNIYISKTSNTVGAEERYEMHTEESVCRRG